MGKESADPLKNTDNHVKKNAPPRRGISGLIKFLAFNYYSG
jgi:hypothetical protein